MITEDDVRRVVREEIERARQLAGPPPLYQTRFPVPPTHTAPWPVPTTYPLYPVQPMPMPPYWYQQPATCASIAAATQ